MNLIITLNLSINSVIGLSTHNNGKLQKRYIKNENRKICGQRIADGCGGEKKGRKDKQIFAAKFVA